MLTRCGASVGDTCAGSDAAMAVAGPLTSGVPKWRFVRSACRQEVVQ